jgi:hypothetical protein
MHLIEGGEDGVEEDAADALDVLLQSA